MAKLLNIPFPGLKMRRKGLYISLWSIITLWGGPKRLERFPFLSVRCKRRPWRTGFPLSGTELFHDLSLSLLVSFVFYFFSFFFIYQGFLLLEVKGWSLLCFSFIWFLRILSLLQQTSTAVYYFQGRGR